MKWERADLGVGLAVVGAVVVLMATLLWLSPAVSRDTYVLETEFTQIGGIAEQAPVYLRGYAVGRVADIEPHMGGDGNLAFRVLLNIQARVGSGDSLLLPVGTVARLVPPPVIGAGFITLELPRDGGSGVFLQPGSRIPGIRDTPMLDQVQTISDSMTAELAVTLETARRLMGTLEQTAGAAGGMIASTATDVPLLLRELREQLRLAQELTSDMRTHMATLVPTTVATIDSTQALLSDSRALLRRLDATIADHTPTIASILANLDTTTLLLEHVSRQVAERPLSVLRGWQPPVGDMRDDSLAQPVLPDTTSNR
ncbi:MAG TPA: MlaD family protein [Longimicrobiales bacterium]|nr:MlaD family protein [Longimicrobiales bacterium]